MDDLDRLFDLLARRIRESQPELLARPFEIAELYQTLVPYRLHRRELELETNGDYELVMMRLLSGERGLLVGDEGMQEFLRTELASPNPDTGVFREFGSNHVALAGNALLAQAAAGGESGAAPPGNRAIDASPAREPDAVTAHAAEPIAETSSGVTRAVSAAFAAVPSTGIVAGSGRQEKSVDRNNGDGDPNEPVSQAIAALESVPLGSSSSPASTPQHSTDAPSTMTTPPQSATPGPTDPMTPTRFVIASDVGGRCRFCAGTLPEGRRIVFCPHCGQNLTVQHCPACSTELEMGWKFCVTCGRSAAVASG